jgi:HlyD family secretion protein
MMLSKVYPEVRDGQFRADFIFTGDIPDNIRSGQTYYMNLQLGQSSNVLVIPRATFYQTTGGAWVYVLDESGERAEVRKIRIGRQNPQYYEVVEGLQEGDRIITSDYKNLSPNEVLILKK